MTSDSSRIVSTANKVTRYLHHSQKEREQTEVEDIYAQLLESLKTVRPTTSYSLERKSSVSKILVSRC
jgi:5'-deoxynucleotidase YfbR-like HD superfamily hydrolase